MFPWEKNSTPTLDKLGESTTSDMQMKLFLVESEEELKSFLMKVASSPVTSWQIGGEKVERVSDFIFLGSKINVDGDCHHEIKRHLLLGRKGMTNLTY